MRKRFPDPVLRAAAPAALLALAAVMPLVAVGHAPSVPPALSHGQGTDCGPSLVQCVAQAARQFCGTAADVVHAPAVDRLDSSSPPAGGRIRELMRSWPEAAPLLATLIDLPPPAV